MTTMASPGTWPVPGVRVAQVPASSWAPLLIAQEQGQQRERPPGFWAPSGWLLSGHQEAETQALLCVSGQIPSTSGPCQMRELD